MSHRGSKAAAEHRHRISMRREGRLDALAGRPARYSDADYQRGYREGSR